MLEKRDRRHFGFNNHGNVIGPVVVPQFNEMWRLPVQAKKECFRKSDVTLMGGTSPDEEKFDKPTFEGGTEPMCWHSTGKLLAEEHVHSMCTKVFLNLTESDGDFAKACMTLRVPYVGVVNNDAHSTHLTNALTTWTFQQFMHAGSTWHIPALTELIGGGERPPPKADPEGSSKAAAVAKAKATNFNKRKSAKSELLAKLKMMEGPVMKNN